MRLEGIQGKKAIYWKCTTKPDRSKVAAPNFLRQDFNAASANEKWVAHITYVSTRDGWLYLAIVLDLFSRRVVGHATGARMTTDLVLSALQQAIRTRRPAPGLLHHSDRGSQYTSGEHVRMLRSAGIGVSMSGTGSCYDNAVAENFFATLKTEAIHHRRFASRAEATSAIFDYIERFYNSRRLHSTLGYVSPMQSEALHQRQVAA
jgi:transposase InsO family protein